MNISGLEAETLTGKTANDSLHTKGQLNNDMHVCVIHLLHPGNGHTTVIKVTILEKKTLYFYQPINIFFL